MAPLYLETRLLRVVGHVLLARLGVLETQEETARVLVTLAVVGSRGHAPRPFGVDFAQQFQVPLVAYGKIISTVSQVEAPIALVAIGRHDESAGIALGEGEETIGNGQWHGHVCYHQVGGAEGHVLSRAHLCPGKGDIEVWVFRVASGIAAMLQVDDTRGVSLRFLSRQEAVLLCGVYIVDERFLGFEVESDGVGVISVLPHFEDGLSFDAVLFGGVCRSRGEDSAAGLVKSHFVTRQVHVLVLHVGFAIKKSLPVDGVIYQ